MSVEPTAVEDVAAGLRDAGYLAGESTALVAFLAIRLGKPVLVEGPAGVGKTELAKAMATYLGRRLVRLQCYEGLDEAKALYEWNYRKQLLRIQAEAQGTGWDAVQDDIFGEEFLLERPLMTAISSPEPVVLLIDEIDKTDQEFEAMLLELLSDFQISIPELGRIEARTHPVVLLTSNNTRELTEALKRRCLYLWLDYPSTEHELEIVRLHAPELPATVAARLVEVIAMVRELDLKKPPSIAESIDWARALLLLGADDITPEVFRSTLSIIVKHRTDLDTVAERVGVRLGAGAGTR
jgi:MoxR-like ATPase